ncbi:MAG TPA: ParA family protein [Sporichthyaceae bacterium]|jgi:cellulose biosynthesis protein BcsQ|nr:ParA family protein [Sporichthyaceae bacterium]
MKVLASYSIKGGVGKTTAAANLSWLAASEGRRTLLWDLDPQGGATFLFRVQPKVKGGAKALVRGGRDFADAIKASDFHNLDILPADFSYRHLDLHLDAQKQPTRRLGLLIDRLAEHYDLVVMDCAPSVSLISENIVRAADLILAPVLPSPLSLRTLDQLADFAADTPGRTPPILAFLSMVDRRRKLHRELAEHVPDARVELAQTSIPAAAMVEQMGVRRAPVTQWAPRSSAGRAYTALWREVADRVK